MGVDQHLEYLDGRIEPTLGDIDSIEIDEPFEIYIPPKRDMRPIKPENICTIEDVRVIVGLLDMAIDINNESTKHARYLTE